MKFSESDFTKNIEIRNKEVMKKGMNVNDRMKDLECSFPLSFCES